MPEIYQHYLIKLLEKVQGKMGVKTLSYLSDSSADYTITGDVWLDLFYRLLFKLRLTNIPSRDIKIMQDYDIIHIQHSFLWRKLLPLLELKNKPKIVITLRGGDTYLKPWTFKRMAEFFKSNTGLIDAFIVMSQDQKKYLTRWGVPENKIYIIPISFGEVSKMEPKYPNYKKLRLVSAFRMTWEKNIQGHLEFAHLLKERNISFEYDIYGDGEALDQLYYLTDKYALTNHINIKRKVSNEELRQKMTDYDFCVQLSLSESLGMVVIEAQSNGLPCIVSDVGGLPEAVVHGQTALVGSLQDLGALADSSLELWHDSNAYFSYSKRAIDYVNANYSINNELTALENLYKRIS